MQKALEIPTQDSMGMLSWFREAGLFDRKKKSPDPFSDPLSLQQMVLSQVIFFSLWSVKTRTQIATSQK